MIVYNEPRIQLHWIIQSAKWVEYEFASFFQIFLLTINIFLHFSLSNKSLI